MEEKEEKSAFKAANLCATFEKSFFKMSYTVHPCNIPGEAQGKSSNESWTAKQVMKDYPEEIVKQNTIITVMDGTYDLFSLSDSNSHYILSRHASLSSLLHPARSTSH